MTMRSIALSLILISNLAIGETLSTQREKLLESIKSVHQPTAEQLKKIKSIIENSSVMSQGNPAVTKHPLSSEECLARAKKSGQAFEVENSEKICGAKFMAPLYDPATEKPEQARRCIDQFEFPNIPCSYPLVWVRANEAQQICSAMGKSLCDAHEWEGGCEGRLAEPDYNFDSIKGMSSNAAQKKMRAAHNRKYGATKAWSYGKAFKKGVCAQNSFKHDGCNGGDWKRCGSNTYPTGSFADCRSALGVYDIHGNTAEHMNLPLTKAQMTSEGSSDLGVTEMKGSWFIWDKYYAHQDWCRWRAPYWHGSKVMDPKSHHNYHLGFRCCKSVR